MVRFHIGVNFLGGGAVDVDEEETGFVVLVGFAVAVKDELSETSFAVAIILIEVFHEFASRLSLTGLLDSEPG